MPLASCNALASILIFMQSELQYVIELCIVVVLHLKIDTQGRVYKSCQRQFGTRTVRNFVIPFDAHDGAKNILHRFIFQ